MQGPVAFIPVYGNIVLHIATFPPALKASQSPGRQGRADTTFRTENPPRISQASCGSSVPWVCIPLVLYGLCGASCSFWGHQSRNKNLSVRLKKKKNLCASSSCLGFFFSIWISFLFFFLASTPLSNTHTPYFERNKRFHTHTHPAPQLEIFRQQSLPFCRVSSNSEAGGCVFQASPRNSFLSEAAANLHQRMKGQLGRLNDRGRYSGEPWGCCMDQLSRWELLLKM